MINIRATLSPVSRFVKKRSSTYRYLHAYAYAWFAKNTPTKESYSQFGEDQIIYQFLMNHGGIKKDWIYVDVGANHPTNISDTYLFSRQGYSGICIEPNGELAGLFQSIRPRDHVLNAAAGNRHGIVKFHETVNPVFSSLLQDELEDEIRKTYFIPLIKLDDLLPDLHSEKVFLLKVDTEGCDQQVLEGACELLRKTLVVLTETKTPAERDERSAFLGSDWRILYAQANTIYVNQAYFGKD